jgi:hypothetical protein
MPVTIIRAAVFILTVSLLFHSVGSQNIRTFASLQSTLNNSVLCIASPASSSTPAKSPLDCARQCMQRGSQCKIASYRSWPSGFCDMYYYSPYLYQPRANCSSFRVRMDIYHVAFLYAPVAYVNVFNSILGCASVKLRFSCMVNEVYGQSESDIG